MFSKVNQMNYAKKKAYVDACTYKNKIINSNNQKLLIFTCLLILL